VGGQGGGQQGIGSRGCRAATGHHEVETAERTALSAKALADQAFQSVPVDGAGCTFFRDGQAETSLAFRIGACEDGKIRVR